MIRILQALALLSASAALLSVAWLAIETTRTERQIALVKTDVDQMVAGLQLQLLGEPGLKPDRKRGLIEEATAAVRESRRTIDVIQATSLAERKKVSEFSAASVQAVQDLSRVESAAADTLVSLNGASRELGNTIVALKQDAQDARPAIDGAAQLLGTLDHGSGEVLHRAGATMDHVDKLVAGMQPIQAELQDTGKHFEEASDFLQQTLHFIRDNFAPRKKSFWLALLDKVTNGAVSGLVSLFLPEHVKVDH